MRTANPDELPQTAAALVANACRCGWSTWSTYADNPAGEKPVSSIAVRLSKGDERLVAVWEDGLFRSGLRRSPLARLKFGEIKSLVEEL